MHSYHYTLFTCTIIHALQDMIESGDVLVNWKEITSANSQLKEGDIVTVRGKGRLEINEVEVTSKGKFRVKLTKFV